MARPDSTRAVTAVRSVKSVTAMAPIAVPIAAVALGLFLLGRLLDALVSGGPGAPASTGTLSPPAAAPVALSTTGVASAPAPSAAVAIDALAVGLYAHVSGGAGVWPRRGLVERFRLDAPPRAPASAPSLAETGALEAVETARAQLGREYRALEVLASRLVVARFLGPEEAGTSIEGGVPSQAGDVMLAERPAWLILFKAEDHSHTLIELLLIDAATGALLLRPPAALFADYESIQLTRHPSLDRTRPLNIFGDAAP